MMARQTFHLQCSGTRTTGTHVEHINYAYAALASQPACQSQFICCFSCLPAANAKRRDSTSLDSTLGHILCRPFIIFHGVDTFTCFSKQTQATTATLTSLFFMATPSSLFFSLPLSLYLTDPSSPFVLSCAGYALSNLLVSI